VRPRATDPAAHTTWRPNLVAQLGAVVGRDSLESKGSGLKESQIIHRQLRPLHRPHQDAISDRWPSS